MTHSLAGKAHPTSYKTRFLACRLYRKFPKNQDFLAKQQTIFYLQNIRHFKDLCQTMGFQCRSRGQSPFQQTAVPVVQFLTLLYEE